MKICLLTPRFPFPQYGGDALRINEIARYLKRKGHELVLVSLSDEENPPVHQAMAIYDKIYFAQRNRVVSIFFSGLYFLTGRPIQCGYYRSSSYLSLLKEVVSKEHPDLYVSHLLRMVPYLETIGVQKQSIVEMTDALSKTYTMSSNAKGGSILKYVYSFEQKLIKQYEQYVIDRFPKVVLVSKADADYLREGREKSSLSVYTNGVDVAENISTQYDSNKLCFVGNMRSVQNQDAVLFFVSEVLPLIKEKKPEVIFHVVGSLPPGSITELASESIVVTGFVDDLNGYISDACCTFAPVRIAAGIQNKVLVAMGCGLPVVMSSLISNGIPGLKNGENCFICDSAEQYASRCFEIMNNVSLRHKLSKEGYAFVKKSYGWDESLNGYENL